MKNILAKKCHVCGELMYHDMDALKEWCLNESCQVYLIQFNIMNTAGKDDKD